MLAYLCAEGRCLIGNCFYPVPPFHLPQPMQLVTEERTAYARMSLCAGIAHAEAALRASKVESPSLRRFPLIEHHRGPIPARVGPSLLEVLP